MVKQGGGDLLGFTSQHKKPTVTQLNHPQSTFLVHFTQALFFICVQYRSSISFVIGIFLLDKKPPKPCKISHNENMFILKG